MTKNNRSASISIFFPFLNDWGTVGSLIYLAVAAVEKITKDWEVIIVNDGSDDKNKQALEMISDAANRNQFRGKIKIITHQRNKGYGGALRSGFEASEKDLVFYTDCDAQYDPRELMNLYQALDEDTDMVNGYKIKRNDPLHRVIAGRLYHYLVRFAFNLPIRDTDCDFRLIRKNVFNKVKLLENTGTICVELVKKIDMLGYKIKEVPVHHYWRTSGKSQFFNFRRLYATFINLLLLWVKLMIKKEYYR